MLRQAARASRHTSSRDADLKQENPPLEKLIAPYKDLTIEAKESPKTPQETTIIDIENMKKLTKTAEILARPMIHTKNGKEHIFYIIDSNTRYQYKAKEEQT